MFIIESLKKRVILNEPNDDTSDDNDTYDQNLHHTVTVAHMSKLLDAMRYKIKEIVIVEDRPFSAGDFERFEVDGQEFKIGHGTYRNYVCILKKNKEIELAFNSGAAAYHTLPGKKFTKSMTVDRMGGTPSPLSAAGRKTPIYRWIKNMSAEKQSLHNIRIVFPTKGIWDVFSTIYPHAYDRESNNKDLRLPAKQFIDDIDVGITIHHTDTVSIAIACSFRPIAVDVNDIVKLFEILIRTEVELSRLIEDYCKTNKVTRQVVVPHYRTWIVKMWHFGVDEIDEYSKEEFHVSIEEGLGDVFRIYTKRMKDGKLKRRAERQEYPNSPVAQAIFDKLYLNGNLIEIMDGSNVLSMNNCSCDDMAQTFAQLRESLQKTGLTTIKDIAETSPHSISEVTGLSITDSEDLCKTALSEIQNNESNINQNFFSKATNFISNERERISTGSKSIDELLGGGIETGALTHFYGDPRTGKTQLCHTLCVLLPLSYGVIYIDTENKFRPERIQAIAKSRGFDINGILQRIQIAKPLDTKQQELRIEAACDAIKKPNSAIKMLIVDSMTDLYRVDYAGRSKLTQKQQKLNKHMHKLSKLAQTNNIAVVVTNQVQYTPDNLFGGSSKPAPIGAQIMLYASTHSVFLNGSDPERILARLVHSPCLPQKDSCFEINESGIGDISEY